MFIKYFTKLILKQKCEKNAHLEHVNELAMKLKETKKSRCLLYYNESEESDEDVSELEDYNDYTQESFQYDSNTNSSTGSINLPEHSSSAFAHYVINNTPKMLQFYPDMNLESIKQVLFDNWNDMSPEQRAPWVTMTEQGHKGYDLVSNTECSNDSSDYDFDDLLNTEEDSEVDESNQSYLQELIHTYNNHKNLQFIDTTHVPTYFRSEPWIQPSKIYEDGVENGELVQVSSVYTTQCQSEVVTQKDPSVVETIVPKHCSLLDTQLDVQSSSQKNISANTYILSSTQ